MYEVIGLSPSERGGVKLTVAYPLVAVAETSVRAPGAVDGDGGGPDGIAVDGAVSVVLAGVADEVALRSTGRAVTEGVIAAVAVL